MITDTERTTITLAHSPDSDDAFMFYGLATNKIDTGALHFEHLLKDIQTLNEEAMRGTYDVTAISFHAYAYIADKYALLPHGASIGDNYGPIVVSREPATEPATDREQGADLLAGAGWPLLGGALAFLVAMRALRRRGASGV